MSMQLKDHIDFNLQSTVTNYIRNGNIPELAKVAPSLADEPFLIEKTNGNDYGNDRAVTGVTVTIGNLAHLVNKLLPDTDQAKPFLELLAPHGIKPEYPTKNYTGVEASLDLPGSKVLDRRGMIDRETLIYDLPTIRELPIFNGRDDTFPDWQKRDFPTDAYKKIFDNVSSKENLIALAAATGGYIGNRLENPTPAKGGLFASRSLADYYDVKVGDLADRFIEKTGLIPQQGNPDEVKQFRDVLFSITAARTLKPASHFPAPLTGKQEDWDNSKDAFIDAVRDRALETLTKLGYRATKDAPPISGQMTSPPEVMSAGQELPKQIERRTP